MSVWQISLLTKAHVRNAFQCGKPALDKFIRELASQYERRDMGRTYVATMPSLQEVLGYYTLAAGAVAFENLPAEAAHKIPRHPIPVIHLGRLAVSDLAKGQGLGKYLLLDALRRSKNLAEQAGIFAVEVFAIDAEAKQFYLKYGFATLMDDANHLYLPMKAIRKLSF
jgi:predicted GNAT family N-acyltransferase